jgi:hypothetical protein
LPISALVRGGSSAVALDCKRNAMPSWPIYATSVVAFSRSTLKLRAESAMIARSFIVPCSEPRSAGPGSSSQRWTGFPAAVVGIMAVIAQRELKMIRQRTKDALAVARRRLAKEGRRLGNPNGAAALRRAAKGNKAAIKQIGEDAAARAEVYRDTLADVDPTGNLSLRMVAEELNRREIESPRGGKWHPASVARLRERLLPLGGD